MKLQLPRKNKYSATSNDAVGKLTSRIRRVLIAAVVVVFVAFFLVGFDGTDDGLSQYNEPQLTGTFIILMITFTIGTLCLVVWSLLKTIRRDKTAWNTSENGVPRTKIFVLTIIGLALTMALSFALGNTDKILINHLPFSDSLTLRLSNMFIASSIAMILMAVMLIIIDWILTKQRK